MAWIEQNECYPKILLSSLSNSYIFFLALSYSYPLRIRCPLGYLIWFFSAACNFQTTNNHQGTRDGNSNVQVNTGFRCHLILNPKKNQKPFFFILLWGHRNIISFGVLFIYMNAKPSVRWFRE